MNQQAATQLSNEWPTETTFLGGRFIKKDLNQLVIHAITESITSSSYSRKGAVQVVKLIPFFSVRLIRGVPFVVPQTSPKKSRRWEPRQRLKRIEGSPWIANNDGTLLIIDWLG